MNCKEKVLSKVKVDDKIELAYEFITLRDDDSSLLVFLHEGLGSIAQWKSFPEELCKKLQLNGLVYERYGYGHSTPFLEKRKADYLYTEANYFLPLLLKKLELTNRKLILVGHSDGASIALIFSAMFPKNIKAVISIAAHVFVDEMSINGIKTMDDFFENNVSFREKLKKYHFNHVESTFYAWSKVWLTEEFSKFNIEHLLPKILAPILAIQGNDDEYGLPRQVHSIVKNGSNSLNKALFVQNTKHSPHFESKQEVMDEIIRFIQNTTL